VAYWRNRRKMSQQFFADQLGKSKSWVDKVERGVRRLDRFSVIYEIADVLELDVQLLLGKDPTRRPEGAPCVDQVDAERLRIALERYDQISAFYHPSTQPLPLSELTKAVGHAWLTFQHCDYGVVSRGLPRLLRDTQAADAAYTGADGRQAAGLLGQVYQLASCVLCKLGESQLAWLAADRAMTTCPRSGDELLCGLAAARVALALAALGRFRTALELDVNIANQIAPIGAVDATPERLSVYGILLLQGAMAAAKLLDAPTVRELLLAAEEAAKQLGGDQNYYATNFGPTNVLFHRVACDVELRQGARAVLTHDSIPPEDFAGMMPERRAQHLIDVARALAQTGELNRAAEILIDADRLAPAEIRCRPAAHELVADLLRRGHSSATSPLTDLADVMGIAA
jgi:transcriptional regulator with XRE-family HTH domain